jgi:hypothetical protein
MISWILILSILMTASFATETKSDEIALSIESEKQDSQLDRTSIQLKYKSNFTFILERHQVINPELDNTKIFGTQLTIGSSLDIDTNTNIYGSIGVASIIKNINYGSLSLKHEISDHLSLESYMQNSPLYTQIPLPQRDKDILSSTAGILINFLNDYTWNTSISRDGDFVLRESHKFSAGHKNILFRNIQLSPKGTILLEKSSKPNPYRFSPENIISASFHLPFILTKFRLWEAALSPGVSYGQYRRHQITSHQYLSGFGLNTSIYTKQICKICLNFEALYETKTLSDSEDKPEEIMEILISISSRE